MADDVKGAGFATPKILRERLLGPISKGEREALEKHIKESYLGEAQVDWLRDAPIDTQAREYQRELVQTTEWKQQFTQTIIDQIAYGGGVIVNTIHVRVKYDNRGGVIYELIDGQQRVNALLDFVNNKYALPNSYFIEDLDLSGLYFSDLIAKGVEYAEIAEKFLSFKLVTAFYEGLTDQETSDMFIYKLNNVHSMNDQEMRNPIIGAMTRWIRDVSRITKKDGGNMHELFTTTVIDGIHKMKYFSLNIKQRRMEIDNWLAELVYMALHEWKNGNTGSITYQGRKMPKITHFYRTTQTEGGKYQQRFSVANKIKKLLDLALEICKLTPDTYNISAFKLQVMTLYARDIEKSCGQIRIDRFVEEWIKMSTDWSDVQKNLYRDMLQYNNKKPMGRFDDLFGGRNENAIRSICMIADAWFAEVNVGIKIDTRNFTKKQIAKKLAEQGNVCYYTGKPLKLEDAAGDHLIPRCMGIDNGGVTEYGNLVVCCAKLNKQKGNMSYEDYKKKLDLAA